LENMQSDLETIGQKLIESTCHVFGDSGVRLEGATRCEPASDWLDPIAVIGFGGETLRGSVSFETPWRLLQASHPARSDAKEDLMDWAGELSNLVLGALKTSLRGTGVRIQLGLPTTFTNREAQAGATGSSKLQYRLRAPEGSVVVRFSAELDAAFEMTAPRRAEVAGEIELF
jgi:hypothetical protein